VPAEDPTRPFEVPQRLNGVHGVFVVESLNTVELARDRVRDLALVLTHPKLRGATGADRAHLNGSAVSNDYDVIIIGTGGGGGTLTYRLASSGRRILVLERGEYLRREPDNWDTRAVFVRNKYKTDETWYDKSGQLFHPGQSYYVGGQTKFYAAILFRLRERDFGEVRHHGGISPAWPLCYEDFAPYYDEAERLSRCEPVPRGAAPADHTAGGAADSARDVAGRVAVSQVRCLSSNANRNGGDVTVRDIIERHPRPMSVDRDVLLRCIDECFECSVTCTSCADACLGESDVSELVRCVRLNLDCAGVCDATGRVVTRQTEPDVGVVRAAVEACVVACRACAEECDRHAAHHDHCRVCAEVCRRCEQACGELLASMG
jgi:choline dehydrogenase-like flavoprotein